MATPSVNSMFNPLKIKVMNIFNALKVYPGNWEVTSRRSFSNEEISAVQSAKIVDSQFGQSVCFMLKSGGMAFIPVSNTCSVSTGSAVDLSKCELLTLSKEGEMDIQRVDVR